MDADEDDGWGRPRPKFEDLASDSEPEQEPHIDGQADSDDATEEVTMSEDTENASDMQVDEVGAAAPAGRVTRVRDYPLPRFDGAPCGELNQLYTNEGHRVDQMKKFYTVWSNNEKDPNRKFTAVFTCPVTGEHFSAGNWENEKDVTNINGVYWYRTKKYAMNAAAAKYLDCASLRRCIGSEKEPYQRCLDAPHLPSDATPTGLPPGVVRPTPLPREDGAEEEMQPGPAPPKRALHEWYLSFAKQLVAKGIVLEMPVDESGAHKESYDCWSKGDEHNKLWTAIFTCHLTNERFPSGKLIGKEDSYEEEYWYYDRNENILVPRDKGADENSMYDSGGVEECLDLQKFHLIWYKTKKEAEAAAAGRAIDCLRYRDGVEHSSATGRYCSEVPYSAEDAPIPDETGGPLGGVEWPILLPDDRLTVRFGVPNLHSLLEAARDEDHWRKRYRERRGDIDEYMGSEAN